VQPRANAIQRSTPASPCHPGRSVQATGVQRERGQVSTGRGNGETPSGSGVAGADAAGADAAATGSGDWRDPTETGGRSGRSGTAQPTSNPRIAATRIELPASLPPAETIRSPRTLLMWLILLEALGALAILIVIVWWTMFAGRDRGEPRDER
jgi:hypothetical protein